MSDKVTIDEAVEAADRAADSLDVLSDTGRAALIQEMRRILAPQPPAISGMPAWVRFNGRWRLGRVQRSGKVIGGRYYNEEDRGWSSSIQHNEWSYATPPVERAPEGTKAWAITDRGDGWWTPNTREQVERCHTVAAYYPLDQLRKWEEERG